MKNCCFGTKSGMIPTLLLGLLLNVSAGADENITINVSNDVRSIPSNPEGRFKGLGINIVGQSNDNNWYANASQTLRDKCARMFWKDLDLRYMRLWNGNGMDNTSYYTADEMYNMYHLYIDDVKGQQTNPLVMIYDPHSGWKYNDPLHCWSSQFTDQMLRDYIVIHAGVVKDLYDKHGWRMNFVEITNEPEVTAGGWSDPAIWSKALTMTRIWREELDNRGFNDVKVIGPSRSAVNSEAPAMIDSFRVDAASRSAWGGYSFHSYGMDMLKSIRNKLDGIDVDIFVTEAGGAPGQKIIANCISDINLGTNYWMHFQGYGVDGNQCSSGKSCEAQPEFGGIRMAAFDNVGTPQMDVYWFTKFFYFREVARTIKVGSRVHLCTSYNTVWNSLGSFLKNRYTNMELTHGDQPPITAAAAEQSDGRWGLIVYNMTASDGNAYGYLPYTPTTFNVAFNVPELAGKGSQEFIVRKIKPNRDTLTLANQIMQNGQITIAGGLLSGELVSLRSVNALTTPVTFTSAEHKKVDAGYLRVQDATAENRSITMEFNLTKANAVNLAVYDISGRMIERITKADCSIGEHRIAWNGKTSGDSNLGKGVYVVRLTVGNSAVRNAMLIVQ